MALSAAKPSLTLDEHFLSSAEVLARSGRPVCRILFPGAIEGKGTRQKLCCHVLLQRLLRVEAELKYVLSYLPFGVLTYPQLRRELKRCSELGEPWPFVLAVVPSSSSRAKFSAPAKASIKSTAIAERGLLRWVRQTARPVLSALAGSM